MLVFWSAKGGVGCTTVALGVSLGIAATNEVLLVDLGGDAPHVLGCPPAALGIADWLTSDAPTDALARLEVDPGHPAVSLLPLGRGELESAQRIDGRRVDDLAAALHGDPRSVIVDAGHIGGEQVGLAGVRRHLVEHLGASTLVTRPCYLALRRAVSLQLPPTQIVLVAEPGRSLSAVDVERTLNAPIAALVDVDPAVARAVDAGLIGSRLPRVFARQIRTML